MANFEIRLLSAKDGSWDQFQADWRLQCEEVGEVVDDYAPEALAMIASAVSGNLLSVGGTSTTHVGAVYDHDTKRFYACCLLNRAMIPGHDGYTLRVRHLLVSPLIDYGVSEVRMYPDVVIGLTLGIVKLSSDVLLSNHIHFHLRSPEDMAYFRAFGTAVGGSKIFASVQTRGAWLYIEKAAAVGTDAAEESK